MIGEIRPMLQLVVDTNLFHEFRRLEDLPWTELGEREEIVLIVSDPVQTELDEHKKSQRARIKRRALAWTKRFRKLTLTDQTDELVNASNPRVIIRLDDTLPSKINGDVLDLTNADDRLVAIAVALFKVNPDQKIALFSDDLRPLRKARQVGLEAIEIPDTWRRKPELTIEDREIERLTNELVKLRKQEPKLALRCSLEQPIKFVLPIYEALSDQQVSEFMKAIKTRYPMENNFERARNLQPLNRFEVSALKLLYHEFCAASEADIERYEQEDYPNWLEQCRRYLTIAHDKLGIDAQRMALSFELTNQGTRPAKDLLITVKTSGAIRILPNEKQENADEGHKIEPSFSLPAMPKAPQGKWETFDLLGSMLDAHYHNPDTPTPYVEQTLRDALEETRRDPNRFYYRERPVQPTASYSMKCKQFRHDERAKRFDLFVLPEVNSLSMDGKNAMVELICGASNLSSPISKNVSVRLACEARSTYDHIQEILVAKRFIASS